MIYQNKKRNRAKVSTSKSKADDASKPNDENVGLINLGCVRNLVDSQAILGNLKQRGVKITDVNKSEIAIVNTCSFIEEAKQESIDTILDLVELKKQGKIKKIIVAGCLAQRYGKELAKEIQEIDAVVGVLALPKEKVQEQVSLTPQHFAYVKICESCYNQCSFCIIPGIKGKFNSRTMESVLEEIKLLDKRGVKEVILIGQDITAYGMDIYKEFRLAKLMKEICAIAKNIKWVRLLYTFPAHMTDELIDVMAKEKKVCKYIDMPLQHISDPILKSMKRNITTQQTKDLINKMRVAMPKASLRTTYILGLPGETQEHFDELLAFIKEYPFDKVGAFTYSHEEGTSAYDMSGQISNEVKEERLRTLMEEQQGISQNLQQRFIGQTLNVLIDEKDQNEEDLYLGRTEYDAPDVDGIVYVKSNKKLNPGDFVDVNIQDALEYDLIGDAA